MVKGVTSPQFRALAELRYRIRLFLREGDSAAIAKGLEPQQYQMLLAIRGLEEGEVANVRTLAGRLIIKHHSAVELIDRLEARGFVRRIRDASDRRQVRLELLPRGEKALASVVRERITELRSSGNAFVHAIETLLERGKVRPKK